MSFTKFKSVTIQAGQSVSDAIDTGEFRLGSIGIPSAWTAADITLLASYDGGVTYKNAKDVAGVEYNIKATANDAIILPMAEMMVLPQFLKLRSGTSVTPVAQASNRSIDFTLIGG